jgi:cytochrome c-type biogenesis protein CcmH/NrfF
MRQFRCKMDKIEEKKLDESLREYFASQIRNGESKNEICQRLIEHGIGKDRVQKIAKEFGNKEKIVWRLVFIVLMLVVVLVFLVGFLYLYNQENLVTCDTSDECPNEYECIENLCVTTVGDVACALYDKDEIYSYYKCVDN